MELSILKNAKHFSHVIKGFQGVAKFIMLEYVAKGEYAGLHAHLISDSKGIYHRLHVRTTDMIAKSVQNEEIKDFTFGLQLKSLHHSLRHITTLSDILVLTFEDEKVCVQCRTKKDVFNTDLRKENHFTSVHLNVMPPNLPVPQYAEAKTKEVEDLIKEFNCINIYIGVKEGKLDIRDGDYMGHGQVFRLADIKHAVKLSLSKKICIYAYHGFPIKIQHKIMNDSFVDVWCSP